MGAGIVVAGNEMGTKVNGLDTEHKGDGHVLMEGLDRLTGQTGRTKTEAIDVLIELLRMGGKSVDQGLA